MGKKIVQSKMFRDSEFQTPLNVADYMVSLLPGPGGNIFRRKIRTVLEPTPGAGNVVQSLRMSGYCVREQKNFFGLLAGPADIGNFYKNYFDAVVMNPPFSWALMHDIPEWITPADKKESCAFFVLRHCLTFAPEVVALLPWNSLLDSPARTRELKDYGLLSVTGLGRNVFKNTPVRTGIYHLRRGYQGKTELKFFE